MSNQTISMRTVECEDGSFNVELIVSGLVSENQAEAAMHFLQEALCGNEMVEQ